MQKIILLLFILISPLLSVVDLNTASKEELMSIKGIGPSKAEAILEYRSMKLFDSIEELANVKGFGAKTIEAIKDKLTVSKPKPLDTKEHAETRE